jgi:hypothetical protein
MNRTSSRWRNIGKWYIFGSAILFQCVLLVFIASQLPLPLISEKGYFLYVSKHSYPPNSRLLFRGSETIFSGLNEIYVISAPKQWIQTLLNQVPWSGAQWGWIDVTGDGTFGTCSLPDEHDERALKALLPPGRYRYAKSYDDDFIKEFIINEQTGTVMMCASD